MYKYSIDILHDSTLFLSLIIILFLAPYVRILQLNPSGRVVRKKKTGPKHGTKEPAFHETLNFELDPSQLDSVVFILLLSHRETSIELQVIYQL